MEKNLPFSNSDSIIETIQDSQNYRLDLLTQKSKDYGRGDMFEAFDKVASITNLPVNKVFEVMLALKVVRICNTNSDANFESKLDSITDLIGYAELNLAYSNLIKKVF
jgi:hypothetical protein